MDRAAKLALVELFMDATNTGRLDLLDECVTADYVQHNPWAGQGLTGVREYFARMLESFPDLHARLDAFITEDDLIAARFTVTGRTGARSRAIPDRQDVRDDDRRLLPRAGRQARRALGRPVPPHAPGSARPPT